MSRVLIVEDEEAIADLEKDYLEVSGFTVEIENNGTADKEGRIEYTKPRIITDSESLGWMETADLTGTITPWDKGVMIHIFVN